jgi:AbrB family looped-hinge helix DNA binding protein
MSEIKIQSYKVQQKGKRGRVMTLPVSWTNDLGLKPGDRIDIYRNENDELILKAEKKEGGS